ncbi:hypothetical protein [Methylobacterium sp. J-077]|uniref:hypothetical protein n=1 Tax=Methylobacterium sp. J-077 TaxID=2836656 RepID=UPI001FBA2CF3|nr:hypothetical protein [Methylobacterium sp. J-077]MCJ2125111.1 hypothetical protein [Methylobacterium sp. J-077]
MLGRRDVLKRIEAEVQDLETRHAGVLRRLETAVDEAEQAIAAQRHLLTAERVDAAAARKAADACRLATDRRAALEDAGRSLHAELDHARARLAAERDRRFRESAASEVEARAQRIEAAAARLDDAAEAFDEAREALVTVCSQDAERNLLGHGPEYALVAAAARRAGVLPRDPLNGKSVAGEIGMDARTVAGRIAGEMRTRARAIREGAAAVVTTQAVDPVPSLGVAWKTVRIVLARAAYYRPTNGRAIKVSAGGCDLPEPIAARALKLGVGFEPTSAQAQQIVGILAAHPSARIQTDGVGGFRGDFSAGSRHPKEVQPALLPADLGDLPDVDADGVFARAAE